MKVYVVTADTWDMGYGSEIYLIGVFQDKDKAEQAANENDGIIGIVTEMTLDEPHPIVNGKNDKYLGGYIE